MYHRHSCSVSCLSRATGMYMTEFSIHRQWCRCSRASARIVGRRHPAAEPGRAIRGSMAARSSKQLHCRAGCSVSSTQAPIRGDSRALPNRPESQLFDCCRWVLLHGATTLRLLRCMITCLYLSHVSGCRANSLERIARCRMHLPCPCIHKAAAGALPKPYSSTRQQRGTC